MEMGQIHVYDEWALVVATDLEERYQVLRFPFYKLKELRRDPDFSKVFNRTYVYILYNSEVAYVGQTTNGFKRLIQHLDDSTDYKDVMVIQYGLKKEMAKGVSEYVEAEFNKLIDKSFPGGTINKVYSDPGIKYEKAQGELIIKGSLKLILALGIDLFHPIRKENKPVVGPIESFQKTTLDLSYCEVARDQHKPFLERMANIAEEMGLKVVVKKIYVALLKNEDTVVRVYFRKDFFIIRIRGDSPKKIGVKGFSYEPSEHDSALPLTCNMPLDCNEESLRKVIESSCSYYERVDSKN